LLSTCQVTIFVPAPLGRVTVIDALPDAPDASEAVMVVEPAATPVARPSAATVATDVLATVQVAVAVTSISEPPRSVAVAVNCCVAPAARFAVAGEAAIALRTLVVLLELRDEVPPQPAAASRERQRNEERTHLQQLRSLMLIWGLQKANQSSAVPTEQRTLSGISIFCELRIRT
jgi:hypothetical protein